MSNLAVYVEQHPEVAQTVFANIDGALNRVLPGSDLHARYRDAEEVGLALLVGRTTQESFNPLPAPPTASFLADNQSERPGAWVPLEASSEFLDGSTTKLGRFVFFVFAKTENLLLTNGNSSYNPNNLAIAPGRVGFAGARRLFGAFVTSSGLWELHDHLVSGVYATEVNDAANGTKEPLTEDQLAELFEREFAKIQNLQLGKEAENLSRRAVGVLLPLIDSLTY